MRGVVSISVAILGLTAALKAMAFWRGGEVLSHVDPLLGITWGTMYLVGASAEIGLIIALLLAEARVAGTCVVSFSAVCLSYHSLYSIYRLRSPCPCFGDAWAWIGVEHGVMSRIAVGLALVLASASLWLIYRSAPDRRTGEAVESRP